MANLGLEFFPDKTCNHQIIRLFCNLGTYLSFPELKNATEGIQIVSELERKRTRGMEILKIAWFWRGKGSRKMAG